MNEFLHPPLPSTSNSGTTKNFRMCSYLQRCCSEDVFHSTSDQQLSSTTSTSHQYMLEQGCWDIFHEMKPHFITNHSQPSERSSSPPHLQSLKSVRVGFAEAQRLGRRWNQQIKRNKTVHLSPFYANSRIMLDPTGDWRCQGPITRKHQARHFFKQLYTHQNPGAIRASLDRLALAL